MLKQSSTRGWSYSLAGIFLFGVICANLQAEPIKELLTGYATTNGGTTGGGTASVVTASTREQFIDYATQDRPLNINVVGTLDVGAVRVKSNKTILGIGSNAGLIGSLQLSGVSNIIVKNLALSNPSGVGEGDVATLRGSTNVWFDHNSFFDSTDGLLDIVRESDFVTASWNKFFYTDDYTSNVNTGHRFAMLIGNGDSATSDAGKLHVTLHHNHWGQNVRERMPRVRYGDIHAFNNYFNADGNNYVVRSAIDAEVLVENNVFEDVDTPFEKQQGGLVEESGNLFIGTSGDHDAGDDVFTPPYEYTPDDASAVKTLVLAESGASRSLEGDFNGDGTVNAADYTVWRDHLGQIAIVTLHNEVDGGEIGTAQYVTWDGNYGSVRSTRRSTSIPEPANALMLLSLVLATALRKRCHR